MPGYVKWLVVCVLAALPILWVAGESIKEAAIPPVVEPNIHHITREMVKQMIRSPEVATFPPDESFRIERLGKDRYRVSAYVDTVNALKTPVRIPFMIEIQQQNGGWQLMRQKLEK